MTGRILMAFSLFGPSLIGIAAPALSFLALRKRRRHPPATAFRGPSVIAVVAASVMWLGLCVGTSLLLLQVAFGFAWGWAHAGRPPLIGEELRLLGYVAGGLMLQSACAFALHRLLFVAHAPAGEAGRAG